MRLMLQFTNYGLCISLPHFNPFFVLVFGHLKHEYAFDRHWTSPATKIKAISLGDKDDKESYNIA